MPLNTIAWNNRIGLRHYFVGLRTEAMINRDNWGYSYFVVRGQNSWIDERRTIAKAFTKDVFINQERKLGDRR